MRMRSSFLPTLLATLPLAAVACTGAAPAATTAELTDAQRMEITQAVDSTVADLYDAMNAHDAERVMAHYLPTNEFLYAGVTNTIQGLETFSTLTSPWYTSHPDVTFEYKVLHIQVLSPDVATITVKGSSTDSPYLLCSRTMVYRDGAWLVALEHESWPGAEVPKPSQHPGT